MSDAIPSKLDVVPATSEHWPAIEAFFRACQPACWCQYWRMSAGDYGRVPRDASGARMDRSDQLQAQIERGPAPGIIALTDDRVVGWCGIGPRPTMERLVRSRTIPTVDDRPVWSVVCFLVRVGYRRRGVARALLAGAVEYARQAGAPGIEAYPVDPEGARIDVTFGYVGFTPLFERAGFRRVLETDSRSANRPRWLMRLDFDDADAAKRA